VVAEWFGSTWFTCITNFVRITLVTLFVIAQIAETTFIILVYRCTRILINTSIHTTFMTLLDFTIIIYPFIKLHIPENWWFPANIYTTEKFRNIDCLSKHEVIETAVAFVD